MIHTLIAVFISVALSIASAMLPPGAAPAPVERIAAVVNGQILFLSDLQRHRLFFEPAEKEDGTGPDQKERLDRLIEHRLFLAEAHRFVLQGPSDKEIDDRLNQVRKRFKTDQAFQEALRQTGFSLEALKEEVRARLWVEKLIQERIQFFIFITPQEIERYRREHPEDFKDKKPEEAEPEIRAILTREKESVKRREYLGRLRSRAEIQINLN